MSTTRANTSTAVTAAAGDPFQPGDVGRTITGTGIPAAATITAVASPTAATLSAAATSSGTSPANLGPGQPSTYGFHGWSPESPAEADSHSVAAVNANQQPRVTSPSVGRTDYHSSRG